MSTAAQPAYDQDFYAWSQHNAALLRKRRVAELDLDNLAEEIEDVGASVKRALGSRLAVLIAHLLKWWLIPERRCKSWASTIKEQRFRIHKLLKESPSLKSRLEEEFTFAYTVAIIQNVGETHLEESDFPATCPFTPEQCLNAGFWPDAA